MGIVTEVRGAVAPFLATLLAQEGWKCTVERRIGDARDTQTFEVPLDRAVIANGRAARVFTNVPSRRVLEQTWGTKLDVQTQGMIADTVAILPDDFITFSEGPHLGETHVVVDTRPLYAAGIILLALRRVSVEGAA